METITCGHCEISSVEESTVPFRTLPEMYPDATEEMVEKHLSWMAPDYMDAETRMMLFSFKSYVIRTGRLTILLDACVGNHKDRPGRPNWHQQNWPYMANLAAVGVRPEEIDIVMCTHLHIDHVGWNTQLKDGRWVPTFPNARYVFAKAEYDHWQKMLGTSEVGDNVFNDSVLPVVEANRADLVAMDHEIDHGIVLEPTPGHTPGHVALHLNSAGDDAVFYRRPVSSPGPGAGASAIEPCVLRSGSFAPVAIRFSEQVRRQRYTDLPGPFHRHGSWSHEIGRRRLAVRIRRRVTLKTPAEHNSPPFCTGLKSPPVPRDRSRPRYGRTVRRRSGSRRSR